MMNATFFTLIVVEIGLAALTIAMWIWRGFLDMKEDDHLLLDEAEAHLEREQAAIRARAGSLSRYIRIFAVMWVLIAAGTFAAWVAGELHLI